MCGIFGWVSSSNSAPNTTLLKELATITESRGRDAFGFAWLDWRGRMRAFKSEGLISRRLHLLDELLDARIVVGHCRAATHGGANVNANNHPHPCDGGWYVHNGIIGRWRELSRQRVIPMSTDCDSEVIGRLIEDNEGSLVDRVRSAVSSASGCGRPFAIAGVWRNPSRVLLGRTNGQPLHYAMAKSGLYFSSLVAGLPSGAKAFTDDHLYSVKLNGDAAPVVKKYPVWVYVRDDEPASLEVPTVRVGTISDLSTWRK